MERPGEGLEEQIEAIERRIREWVKDDRAVKAIIAIPGVGLLTATAAVARWAARRRSDPDEEFAAWAGLLPRENGSGGKVESSGISKRGDTYLRTLLVHGARSVLMRLERPVLGSSSGQRRPSECRDCRHGKQDRPDDLGGLAHHRPYERIRKREARLQVTHKIRVDS